MDLEVTGGRLEGTTADTLVLHVVRDERRLSGHAAAVDRALGGALGRMRREGLLTGRRGEHVWVPTLGALEASRVALVGLGDAAGCTADTLRAEAGAAARWLREQGGGRIAWSLQLPGADLPVGRVAEVVAEGVGLGLYRFDRHHTRAADRPRHRVDALTLVAPQARDRSAAEGGARLGRVLAEATNTARDLANEPANLMTPTIVAQRAQQIAAAGGMHCRVIERAEAERLGMGSYLSVANGSEQPPKFIVMRYDGRPRGPWIGLVGKGITFDSGGISLKPGAGMERMKGDMSGAAAVLATMQAVGALRPRVNVLAVAPCTENLPSGSATKPGDVVYAMDGQSIEILNTDAEGRLVLADGIAFARGEGCERIIDVATLTGAMSVALGDVRTGAFATDDALYAALERAAQDGGEPLWRLPLDDAYDRLIRSDVADMKNTGGRTAGSITAAKFLQRFARDTPWAHLDIAGVMDVAAARGEFPKGASGKPVRTLVRFLLGEEPRRGRARG